MPIDNIIAHAKQIGFLEAVDRMVDIVNAICSNASLSSSNTTLRRSLIDSLDRLMKEKRSA